MRVPTRRRRLPWAALLWGGGFALLLLLLQPTQAMRILEGRASDLRARTLADPSGVHPDILLVTIDDPSLDILQASLGRWPWPRDVHAALVDILAAGGARLVIFDVGFYDPLPSAPEGDLLFAESIQLAGNVILPVAFDRRRAADAARLEQLLGRSAERALLQRQRVGSAAAPGTNPDFGGVLVPLPLFAEGAAGLGAATFLPDAEDGVTRRDPLVFAHREDLYPSLALAAARVLDPDRFGGTVELGDREVRTGGGSLPLDRGGLLLRWRGSFLSGGEHTYPVIPVYQLLNSYEQLLRGEEPDVPLDRLAGKVVLVGLTGMGLFEARATPLAPHDPGVMLHATALDNLLTGDYLRRAPPWLDRGATVLLVLALTMAVSLLPLAAGVILVVLGAGVVVAWSFGTYHAGLWTDLATPLLGTGMSFAGAMAARYVTEGRERRRIREIFGRYVSPEYVKMLAEHPESLRLGGERVPLSILFSDIRGFTSISERLPPEKVVAILNRYLERMSEIVFRNGGTLDKFMGDGLMAFWGAPLPEPEHARKALTAGVEMLEAVDAFAAEIRREEGVELDIGVGVHTGEAVVGNIGSLALKLDYTALGDHVNLASRLESLNKERGTRFLASRAAWEAAGRGFRARELPPARVRGKEGAIPIVEILGRLPVLIVLLPLVAALAGLGTAPAPLEAQAPAVERSRWVDRVYVPGSWVGGRLVPAVAPSSDSLALVAVVNGYAHPPRWRLEVQSVTGAGQLAAAQVLVGDGEIIQVLTPVGSSPLDDHALGQEPMIRFLVGTLPGGVPRFPSREEALVQVEEGETLRTLRRERLVRPEFSDDLLVSGRAGRLGRSLLRLTTQEVGDQRGAQFAATAGARGVRVRTPDGEVQLTPDLAAVARMERRALSVVELDRFRREGGLGGAP